MNKKISLGAAVAFMLIVAAATFSITMIYSQGVFNNKMNALTERADLYNKFDEIDGAVRQNYNGFINETQLMDSVARGYMEGIGGQFATYLSAEEYQRQNTQGLQGESVGIGAVLEVGADGYLVVQEVYDESPAQLVGMQEGDLIVRVGDTDLTTENSAQILSEIPGAQGTKVSLTIRKGGEELLVEPTRRAVTASTVEGRMADDTVGYLWIKEFNDNTPDQFNRELQKLLNDGANSLIVDLRDNVDGNLKAASRIMDRLLPGGDLVRYASSLNAEGDDFTVLHTSDANEIDLPMVIITNEKTSDAAELFAQNIKDFDKGRTVGITTAGNWLMQEIIQLSDGSAIELAVAYYFSYSGESLHNQGVKPDYEVVTDMDWTLMSDQTDAQLIKAVEVAQSMERTTELQVAAEAEEADEQQEDEE